MNRTDYVNALFSRFEEDCGPELSKAHKDFFDAIRFLDVDLQNTIYTRAGHIEHAAAHEAFLAGFDAAVDLMKGGEING